MTATKDKATIPSGRAASVAEEAAAAIVVGGPQPFNVNEALAVVMGKITAIEKAAKNISSGYSARSIDDVLDTLHPLLAGVGLVVLTEVMHAEYDTYKNAKGTLLTNCRLRVAFHFTAADGTQATIVMQGEARDSADKATNKAVTGALKYGLLNTFLVPVRGMPDADTETLEATAHATAEAPPQADHPAVAAQKAVLELVDGDRVAAKALWDLAAAQAAPGVDLQQIDATVGLAIVAAAQKLKER